MIATSRLATRNEKLLNLETHLENPNPLARLYDLQCLRSRENEKFSDKLPNISLHVASLDAANTANPGGCDRMRNSGRVAPPRVLKFGVFFGA